MALLCSDATTSVEFGNFHEEASTLVSLPISKYPLAVLAIICAILCNQNCVLRPDLWAISRTITETMALQPSPRWSKVMKPAQKSDFAQVRLKQTHHVHIKLRLFPLSIATRAFAFAMDKSRFNVLNYLWVTTLSPRVPKSYFDWSKRSDPFLGR